MLRSGYVRHHSRHVGRRDLLSLVLPGVVLLKELFAHEALVTDATLVLRQHVLRVALPDVSTETAEVHETERTVLAAVGTIARVFVDVVFETVLETVAFRTERTLVLSFNLSTNWLLFGTA